MTDEGEQIFENNVVDCAKDFLNVLPENERPQLVNTMDNTREVINRMLSEYEKTNSAFIDEISDLDHKS